MEARAPPLESLSRHRKQLHAHLLRHGYPFPPAEDPEPDRTYLSVLRAAGAAQVLALTACVYLRRAGLPAPGRRALPALLRAATRTRCAGSVGSAHGLAVRVGVEDDGFVGTALVGAYAACWRVADARRVFDGMSDRDLVAWGVILDSYFQTQDYKEALILLNKMKRSRVFPDQVILATVLSTCGHTLHLRSGKIIHAYILVSGICIDARLSSSLINMYATCADMEMAKKLYNGIQRKDLVSSTAMVCGYAKNGRIELARSIFNGMPDKDVVSWSAMISVYAESNQPSEALNLFKDMQECGVSPDEITILSVISACANIGSLDKASWIHSFVWNHGFCKILSICNALIDMFSKCGSLAFALNMFNAMPRKNVITWTSMISAFAMHGDGRSALNLFGKMRSEGIEPNGVTFLCLLYACCHAGLVAEGRSLFESMVQEYRFEPKHEHYGCMVDLMGKSKLLQEAVDLVEAMHIKPNVAVWGSLLTACWMHGDLERAAFAAKKILELDPNHDGAYVLLSKIHAKSGNWDNAREMMGVMEVHGVSKETGCSWVELNGAFQNFGARGVSRGSRQNSTALHHDTVFWPHLTSENHMQWTTECCIWAERKRVVHLDSREARQSREPNLDRGQPSWQGPDRTMTVAYLIFGIHAEGSKSQPQATAATMPAATVKNMTAICSEESRGEARRRRLWWFY